MLNIKILSLNVRGLRNEVKRRAIFAYLKRQKSDIFCLQETFSNKDDEKNWLDEWGGKMFFSHGTKHSKGICILQRPLFTANLTCLESDPDGRFIIAKLEVGKEEIYLSSIYAPSDHRQQSAFIQSISKNLMSFTDTSKLIVVGDCMEYNPKFN